eukprot:CAMPEP_0170549154 /NCGR_PEP_ID=MMETSP0211-20121228/7347_1 /TAXON_ID=311385 /ORGANISM="Pseudokeronopsis sp., Strain OXSARD2" /LENGTH=39 /DNA_ID= /DNA_START= /DNA_END= /DNA_ORIENTATION=
MTYTDKTTTLDDLTCAPKDFFPLELGFNATDKAASANLT